MGKVIRSTYPIQFSIGLLVLIFLIATFLAHQIFAIPLLELNQHKNVYVGMVLVGIAVITMILIMWEEILFPVRTKEIEGGLMFRNHRQKLKTQVLIYCIVPAIFTFIYLEYEINLTRFIVVATICLIPPVLDKLVSGINNYNDFLSLTDTEIAYKDNQKEGHFKLTDIAGIKIIKTENNATEKLQLFFTNNDSLIIDLDKMELDAFYDTINEFITTHYAHLLK